MLTRFDKGYGTTLTFLRNYWNLHILKQCLLTKLAVGKDIEFYQYQLNCWFITICLFLLTDLLAHAVEAPEDWQLGGCGTVLLLLFALLAALRHHALPAQRPLCLSHWDLQLLAELDGLAPGQLPHALHLDRGLFEDSSPAAVAACSRWRICRCSEIELSSSTRRLQIFPARKKSSRRFVYIVSRHLLNTPSSCTLLSTLELLHIGRNL